MDMKHIPIKSSSDLFEEAHKLVQASEPFAWVTIVGSEGSSARHLGASMIVTQDGRVIGTVGGAISELQVIEQASQAIKERRPRTVKMPLPICAGVITCFINVFQSNETLILIGAGHVAQPMARLGKMLGFRVIVIDERPEYATRERFPDADQLIVDSWEKTLGEVRIDDSSFIVIMTYGGENDELALRKVISSEAAYIGMIASRSKARSILARLQRDKIPDELLRRVTTPIGLDIGAETPAEIAVSTMAQIIMFRKQTTGKPMSIAQQEIGKDLAKPFQSFKSPDSGGTR
jgi:xanthine dehydrogenase accessory factor